LAKELMFKTRRRLNDSRHQEQMGLKKPKSRTDKSFEVNREAATVGSVQLESLKEQ